MAKNKQINLKSIDKRVLVFTAIMVCGFFLLLPKISSLKDSYHVLLNANLGYFSLATICMGCTFPAAAGVYIFLSQHKLSLYPTTLVSLAAIFVNKLLPASSGTVALNIRYLTKKGHSLVQASSIVIINNIVGLLGHLTILVTVSVVARKPFWSSLVIRIPQINSKIALFSLSLLIVVLILAIKYKSKLLMVMKQITEYTKYLLSQPKRCMGALACAMFITTGYALTLYFSTLATGQSVSILEAYYVLTIGVAAASLTPTPGGIGGAEVGLVAALASLGIPVGPSLATAILYRFISYWLPILPGAFALHIANIRRYV